MNAFFGLIAFGIIGIFILMMLGAAKSKVQEHLDFKSGKLQRDAMERLSKGNPLAGVTQKSNPSPMSGVKNSNQKKSNPFFALLVIIVFGSIFFLWLSVDHGGNSSSKRQYSDSKSSTKFWGKSNTCDSTAYFDKFKDGAGMWRDSSGKFCSK